MNLRKLPILSCALVLSSISAMAQANWTVARTLPLGGQGGWDYVTVDAQTHRIFLTRSTHTLVVDPATGRILADIPGQKSAHGVALVPSANRGFITDGGGDGAILIFDLRTYAVLGRITTVPDSDGIIYDPALNRVLAVSGDGGILMSFSPDLDPHNGTFETIDLGGKPEFLASDGTGKVYVNLEDKDLVAEVDLHANKVIARWPVAPGGHPVGLSLDARRHRLFIGCRNPQRLVVMSTEDGQVLGSVPIGAGVDATIFDRGQAFASCRDGSLVVAGEQGGSYTVEQIVQTAAGARTMGLDPSTQTIYLPTADFESPAPGPNTARPKPKPDTFKLVEVNRSPHL